MEKNQKRNSEFHLPEEMIQHIQSHMRDQRDAARTTLLSKSWFGAWTTRPNLKFNQLYFRKRMDEFPEFTKKTMQRYEDRNLKIKSFTLWMNMFEDHSLPSELILKAIKLGANDLNIIIRPKTTSTSFVLPDEVLQSKTLARLSVSGCTIDLERIIRKKEVIITFPNLKSLNLSFMNVKGDLFGNLISRCPSIEELELKSLRLSLNPLLRLPFDVAKLIQPHKLKYLRLEYLDIGYIFSESDMWPKFTGLKELVIMYYYECKPNVRISSTSLERITISSYNANSIVNVEFNVPNLKKFKFKGNALPCLGKSSRGWKADVEINCSVCSNVSASWFSSLNQLAKMLGPSRVYLSIHFWCDQGDGYTYVGDGLAIPTLEKMTINSLFAMSPAFLDALLCSCRPNFLSIQRQCVVGFERGNVEEFPRLRSLLWEKLLDPSKRDEDKSELVCFQLK